LVVSVRADVAHLAAMPTLDEAGEVDTAGFLAAALVSPRLRTGFR
jgi:hypothetical protein